MDELEIAGKQFISTRRAGREHGYHSDYIGQLIRGGKVTGQKVGRSWYVNAESLATYLNKEYIAPKKPDVVIESLDTVLPKEEKAQPEPVVIEQVEKKEAKIPVLVEVAPVEAMPVVVRDEKIEVKEIVPQEEKEEESRPIVIHKPEPVAPVQILEEKEEKLIGLTYVHDDSPTLPQVRRANEDEHEVSMPMAQAAVLHASQGSTFSIAKGAAFASVIGLALVLGATVAAYLTSNMKVVGDTANAYYSIGQ